MTLLSSNPSQKEDHDKSSSSSATPDLPQRIPSTTHTTTSPDAPGPRPISPPLAGERGSFSARPVTVACDPSELEPSDGKAAECLHNYQTYMAKYFPFVVIPPDTTIAALRNTKPFLLKAIVVVSSVQDLARQRALGHALMRELTTKLLVEGKRSVDMLQGILVWLAWYVLCHKSAVLPGSRETSPAASARLIPGITGITSTFSPTRRRPISCNLPSGW